MSMLNSAEYEMYVTSLFVNTLVLHAVEIRCSVELSIQKFYKLCAWDKVWSAHSISSIFVYEMVKALVRLDK